MALGPNPLPSPRPMSSQASESRRPGKAPLACYYCRRKKVKCSGTSPCQQCSKRGLALECRIPNHHQRKPHSNMQHEVPINAAQPGAWSQVPDQRINQNMGQVVPILHPPLIQDSIQQVQPEPQAIVNLDDPVFEPGTIEEVSPASTILADTSLSSSHTFGSKMQQLLSHSQQQNPGAGATPPNHFSPTSRTRMQRQLGDENAPKIPSEQHARRLLEAVVFFIGHTQYHFDAREISDRISCLAQKPADTSQDKFKSPELVEVILIVAVGKLFLGEFDEGRLPGSSLFAFAQKNIPHLGELCNLGRLGIELMALMAVYLQNSNQEKEAYIYISTALRLAVSHGFHRRSEVAHYAHSERVHLNRLWWTVYMQERRLAAAISSPSGINDDVIELDLPTDSPGFNPAAPLCTNIKIGRVTGRIISVIYGKNPQPEQSFVSSVQQILQAISDISRELPSELEPGRFNSTSEVTFRAVASLHFMLCQATLLTIRPVMLHVANLILSGNVSSPERLSASPLGKLCRTCCEAARRLLKVIVMLREKDMLVVFGFIDFDATFSAAFITILSAVFDLMGHDRVGVHSPPGLQDAIETMRFLVKRGNLAALERLQEIERLWMLMQSLLRNIRPTRVQHPSEPINNESSQGGIQIGPNLDQVVTAGNEHSDIRIELSLLDDNLWDTINNLWLPAQDNQILGHKAMSRIIECDQGSYWSLYNNPGWELTGEHTVDFAEFERHLEDLCK
ncbi:hypothetical protein BKA59DRAFT_487352 [Fusarium tricinctum]|uniref:Zn(2)-C6 fungal-type domain-containing protein n=1 Tax=Fusarium tricinctum TaxID=61284 RepID=A0A8K0RJF1_9HYPO|nr:hypothetical protein BKA59DRAFT_487352 [Fusarium tricinctum]